MLMTENRFPTALIARKIQRITWMPVMVPGFRIDIPAMPAGGIWPGIGCPGDCCIGPYAPAGPAICCCPGWGGGTGWYWRCMRSGGGGGMVMG
jgi:hypothetical protein